MCLSSLLSVFLTLLCPSMLLYPSHSNSFCTVVLHVRSAWSIWHWRESSSDFGAPWLAAWSFRSALRWLLAECSAWAEALANHRTRIAVVKDGWMAVLRSVYVYSPDNIVGVAVRHQDWCFNPCWFILSLCIWNSQLQLTDDICKRMTNFVSHNSNK